MRIRIPLWYDKAMDKIATLMFPPDKPTGLKLAKKNLTWLDLSLVGYTILLAVGVAWLFGHWVWIPITIACMIGAAIWMSK